MTVAGAVVRATERIVVLGSTGGTGRAVTAEALRRGHEVVAVARRPADLDVRHDRLSVVPADVLESGSLDSAVEGATAVVSALGIGMHRHATRVYSGGVGAAITAMERAGVQRLITLSTSSLSVPPRRQLSEWAMARFVLHPLLRRPYRDITAMEQRLWASSTAWTVVRAARLTDGPATGRYRVARDGRLQRCWSISRTDLAAALLDLLDDRSAVHHVFDVAY